MALAAARHQHGGVEADAQIAVVTDAAKKRDLHLDIPSRTLSNVRYSPRKRILEMGSNKNRRQLFNLSQAKAYMQTMLVGSGCKQLIEEGWLQARAVIGLFPANSSGDDIELYKDDERKQVLTTLHNLRKQGRQPKGKYNDCLADFVAPTGNGKSDWIGGFAVSALASANRTDALRPAWPQPHIVIGLSRWMTMLLEKTRCVLSVSAAAGGKAQRTA